MNQTLRLEILDRLGQIVTVHTITVGRNPGNKTALDIPHEEYTIRATVTNDATHN